MTVDASVLAPYLTPLLSLPVYLDWDVALYKMDGKPNLCVILKNDRGHATRVLVHPERWHVFCRLLDVKCVPTIAIPPRSTLR